MRERSSVADSSCSGRSLSDVDARALTPQRVSAGKARKSFVCLICKFATARPRGQTNSRDCKSKLHASASSWLRAPTESRWTPRPRQVLSRRCRR